MSINRYGLFALLALTSLVASACFPSAADLLAERDRRIAAEERASSNQRALITEQQYLERLREEANKKQDAKIHELQAKHDKLLRKYKDLKSKLNSCRTECEASVPP